MRRAPIRRLPRLFVTTMLTAVVWTALSGAPAARQRAQELPAPVLLELRHLEEAFRLLDAAAADIWTGWKDYKDTPVLFQFQNGLSLLVGHPNPPAPFAVVEGVMCAGKMVHADRSRVGAQPLQGRLRGGGGPIPFSTADGGAINVLRMSMGSAGSRAPDAGWTAASSTEAQLLVYVHELFHMFQRQHLSLARLPNLEYNPDRHYAVHSEIEGLALLRAYREADPAKARLRVEEFLVARDLKRTGSMTAQQQAQESAEEALEGLATYAEVRLLETIRARGFTPGLSPADDPDYRGFQDTAPLLADYTTRLAADAAKTNDPRNKTYTYGCFLALLAQRLAPGWQTAVSTGTALEAALAAQVVVSPQTRPAIQARLRAEYPLTEITARHAAVIDARDAAYALLSARTGRAYVLDFSPIRLLALRAFAGDREEHALGQRRFYPKGMAGRKVGEVELSSIDVPAEGHYQYYLKIVDTEGKSAAQPYAVTGTRQPDGTWKNAVVQTPFFTLRAPHVSIVETARRVRIKVLARSAG